MWSALRAFRITDAIDILLVAAVLYRVFVMFKETRAVQMLLGLGGLMVVSFAARRFDLFSTSYLLENFWSFWVLALVVLFQPELRRALARLGQSRLFQGVTVGVREQQGRLIDDVVKAADALAGKRIGALLVLERTTGLRNYAELGVHLDALVSSDLLESLFLPYSPLHDGAVFIRGDRVAAAGCFLPLSRNTQLGRAMGTRHGPLSARRGDRCGRARRLRGEWPDLAGVGGHMETLLDREAAPPTRGAVLAAARVRRAAGRLVDARLDGFASDGLASLGDEASRSSSHLPSGSS
jgi:diadenylate cyclase